jgi:hypothetical protein
MYVNLGKVKPGSTVFIPFQTFDSNDPAASVTITGLTITDIEVYKDASMTQRGSDAGYTLVDTDGIDIDGITGIHGFTIDLSDNTTANFWSAGSNYVVVVSSITVDGGTVNFIPVRFTIGYDGAFHETTIATLASQTSFTLTTGSTDNDAYNGCKVIVHDIASGVQFCIGYVSDYTGISKTVTLAADPAIFTMAAGDNISFFMPVSSGGDASLANQTIIINHLTDIKGATFASATDSLEAIRDRGDVAWITGGGGGGSSTVIITVQLSGGIPIQDCSVQIWNTALTALVSYSSTNANGQVTLTADDGNYKVKLRKGGYSFTDPENLTVAGTTTIVYTGSSITPSAPASVASCRIYDFAYDIDGATPVITLIAIAKIVSLPEDLNNVLHSGAEMQATYNSSTGLFYWDIVRGAKVEFEVHNFGLKKSATIPDSDIVRLSNL